MSPRRRRKGEAMKEKNIYVDMDGTLFEWKEATEAELESYMYYERLRPSPEMRDFLKDLKQSRHVNLFILSHCMNDAAMEGKDGSLDSDRVLSRLFPKENRIFLPYGKSKALEILRRTGRHRLCRDDILLDDHTANCEEWTSRGGRAVKVLNGINGKGGRWNGERMDLSGNLSFPPGPCRTTEMPDECAEKLVYMIYRSAFDDVKKRNAYSGQAMSFLKRDPYGVMTERLTVALIKRGYRIS